MNNLKVENRSLGSIIDLAFVRRWWFVVILGAAGAGGATYAFIQQEIPIYESEARIVIQDVGLVISETHSPKTYDREFLSTQTEVIRSPTIIKKSLEDLPLTEAELIEAGEFPVAFINEFLRATPIANTDIVAIAFQHTDPVRATERLESIIETYREHLLEVERESATRSVKLLTKQKEDLANQLRTLQDEMVAARKQSSDSVAGETANESPLLRELTTRWVAVEAELVKVDADLNADATTKNTVPSSLSEELTREIATLAQSLSDAKSAAAQAESIYGKSHPSLSTALGRVKALEDQYTALMARTKSNLKNERVRLETEKESLKKMIVKENERLAVANVSKLEETRIQSEIERVSELYATTAESLETVRMADRSLSSGRSSVVVEVLDDYAIPVEPVWPKPVPLMGIGIILGGLLALAGAVLLDQLFRRKQLPSESRALSTNISVEVEYATEEEIERELSDPYAVKVGPSAKGRIPR